jgi:GMP synthase PP-ATPase subunit
MTDEELLAKVNTISLKHDLKAEFLSKAHTVGVRGDARSYLPTVVLVGAFPGWDVLEEISSEITNNLEIGKVTYELARKT